MQEGGGLLHCICVEYHGLFVCLFVWGFFWGGGGGGAEMLFENMPLKPASSWLIFTHEKLTSRVHWFSKDLEAEVSPFALPPSLELELSLPTHNHSLHWAELE